MKEVSSKIRNWCARGERSPAQVLRKLSDWGVVGEAQEELAALMKEDYVNVSRFAEAFIHDHIVLKNWGPAKVWSALRQVHGLDSVIIRSGIEALGRQEVEAAARRALRAWRQVRPDAPDEKALAALVRKGFEYESARGALEAMDAD